MKTVKADLPNELKSVEIHTFSDWHNRTITKNGETHSVSEWAEIIGIKPATLYARIFTYNWEIEKALSK